MPPAAFRFGPFAVDRAAYELTRDGAAPRSPSRDPRSPLIDLRAVRQLAAGANEAVA